MLKESLMSRNQQISSLVLKRYQQTVRVSQIQADPFLQLMIAQSNSIPTNLDQSFYTPQMRQVITGWFQTISLKMQLSGSSVVRAIYLMDRLHSPLFIVQLQRLYSWVQKQPQFTSRGLFEAIGICVLDIACKVEGIRAPKNFFRFLSCEPKQFLDLELKILEALQFSVTQYTGSDFVVEYLKQIKGVMCIEEKQVEILANSLVISCQQQFVEVQPHIIGAIAVFKAMEKLHSKIGGMKVISAIFYKYQIELMDIRIMADDI
ncbi:Cyclin [Hexamita inflata]|uniref:Cyclin n=1 Tax=Hexamita inflata TaxID=28002 RepID=A0AA86QX12_9EUKA|nr:Cyclin [Hexamita inflata]